MEIFMKIYIKKSHSSSKIKKINKKFKNKIAFKIQMKLICMPMKHNLHINNKNS